MYLYREEDFKELKKTWLKMSGVEQLKRIKEAFEIAKRCGYNITLIRGKRYTLHKQNRI